MRQFADLWRALEKREEELIAEERAKRGKKAKNTNDCAAEGCMVRGVPTGTLKACAGKCPQALKPWYCTKACQKKVWFLIVYVCERALLTSIDRIGRDTG